jgi:hypothetical protein
MRSEARRALTSARASRALLEPPPTAGEPGIGDRPWAR